MGEYPELPNTAPEPTRAAPRVYGWFGLYNDYQVCKATRPSAWLSFCPLGHIHTSWKSRDSR
jgi:hypothetical protein